MALCLPLAVILGYFLSDPLEPSSVTLVGFVLAALSVPLLMKWNHSLLIFSWNAAFVLGFLPGQPYLWTLLAVIGFFLGILNRSVDSTKRFLDVPSIRNSLIVLGAVVAITAYFNGGIGMLALGSSQYGGKRYFYIFAAIIGYFALTSQRIPAHRANLLVTLFFLSMLTGLIPNFIVMLAGRVDFIYNFFSTESSGEQINAIMAGNDTARIFGLTMLATGLTCFLFAKYGIRGIFQIRKFWRMGFLVVAFGACLMGGFRSFLILLGLLFMVQFYLEGLHRTRFLGIIGGLALLGGAVTLTQSLRLPFYIQRTLSILPIEVSPEARDSATSTLDWRLQMWQVLLPEVPKHLLMGKGYSIDRTAMYFSSDASHQEDGGFEWAVVAGDYHNGPLSLIIPFGIWGVIAFVWFLCASIRYLYQQHRAGDPDLQQINTLLLSFFLARLILWTIFVGGFFGDLYLFTGIIGLSVSLNGVKSVEATVPVTEALEDDFEQQRQYRDDCA